MGVGIELLLAFVGVCAVLLLGGGPLRAGSVALLTMGVVDALFAVGFGRLPSGLAVGLAIVGALGLVVDLATTPVTGDREGR